MLFQTWQFGVFFIIVYLGYLLLRNTKFWLHWLLAASLFFYAWWNPIYLPLLLYYIGLNYFVVVMMEKSRRKKLWLVIGVINGLSLLAFFKYANFITKNLNVVFLFLKIPAHIPPSNIILPIGISFFTFQGIGYIIDYHRNVLKKRPSFIQFATFKSFFPQLLCGPVERSTNLLQQMYAKPKITRENVLTGLSIFVVGFFKKVALADYLSLYVDKVYISPGSYDSLSLVMATFAFGWQIYFDFSGYTDMARGLAKMMGFDLLLNFNNPYLATGLGEFWNRWHITLSSWFKDYLYVPLGGNRRGKIRTYKNIFLTMIIAGLWHGAAWTFVIWGGVHAFGRFLTREMERTRFYAEKIPRLIKQIFVFCIVTFAWIFFRAKGLDNAVLIVKRIFDFRTKNSGFLISAHFPVLALILIFSVWVYQFMSESKMRKCLETTHVKTIIMICMLFYLLMFTGSSGKPFIYFQF